MQSVQNESPLYQLPPMMWTMGAVGWLGCHVVKYLFFPAAMATPLGCAAGAMFACPAAAICAFMVGYGANMMDKSYAKPALFYSFVVSYPIIGYNFCLMLSKGAAISAGLSFSAAAILSIALATLLWMPWKENVQIPLFSENV